MIGGFFNRNGRTQGWAALRFVSPSGLQLVQVTRPAGGHRPAVSGCDGFPLDGNGASLERVCKEAQLRRWTCTLLLGPGEYQMLLVEMPNVPAEELGSALRWRVKDLLDYPVEEATVEVLEIPDRGMPGRSKALYAIAARTPLLRERVLRLKAAKVPLQVIDVPEMAQRNLATLHDPAGAVALLAFDGSGGLFTVTQGGDLYLTRRIEVTLGELQDADEARARQHLERVALELQRSLDHVDRQLPFIALDKLLLGPLPAPVGLREFLAENLGIPVTTLDLAQLMDFSAVPELADPAEQCAHFHILGAALRGEVGHA
jgi:MSHA biogenesis protein MshI